MELIVEIGTDKQKSLIERELHLIQTVADTFDPPLNIVQAIVPADFDQKVNQLTNTENYKSLRVNAVTVAKILEIDGGTAIILSPIIYTIDWDTQMRAFIYLHEILHVANKRQIIRPEIQSSSSSFYFENIYRIFDEYAADRKALELIDDKFPEKSVKMRCHIDSNVSLFIQMINNPRYYEQIKKEIAHFRVHADVMTLLNNIRDSCSELSVSIAHLYSYIDSYTDYQGKIAELNNPRLINSETNALIDFFRLQYTEKQPDLHSGLNLVKEYIANFGLRFEDTTQGLYCRVTDI